MPVSFRPQFSRPAPFFSGLLLMSALLVGCRQDMHDQPKMFPLRSTSLFPDGRSVRPQATGTVARSQRETTGYFATGMVDGAEGDGLPFKATEEVLRRGQERYNIFCTPCHSRVGNGKGMIVQRGYYQATSFHSDRLRRAPLGHFFTVISNGYGAMPDYSSQISPQDRWAIVAYIRALQLSQSATQEEVPSGKQVLPMSVLAEEAGLSKDFLGSWSDATGQHVHPTVDSASLSPSAQGEAPLPGDASHAAMPTAVTGNKKGVEVAGGGKQGASTLGSSSTAPAKSPAGNAENGKKLYAANCSVCHQPTRAGMPPVFPSLIGVVDRVGEARVRTVARTGIPDAKPPMPPHPDLTDKDISDLVAFLRTK
jgi:mono/diheme cytochrome c family protein